MIQEPFQYTHTHTYHIFIHFLLLTGKLQLPNFFGWLTDLHTRIDSRMTYMSDLVNC
jgi:hypothetical protein